MTGLDIAHSYEKTLNRLAQKSINAERLYELADEKDGTACRSPFARDRDRIIFSKAFRRLTHKTQLYISHGGNEHNRTRLTHTIEVAQIARTLARNLYMNEELVEAIAYGHDVGHSPFGHAGERQINRFLKGKEPLPRRVRDRIKKDHYEEEDFNGDFRHNYQSIRVLTFLEKYHPDYEGLDLTVSCLEGILKHTNIKPIIDLGKPFNFPGIKESGGIFSKLDIEKEYSVSIEGQVVSIADEIAQVTHDINDALRIGALSVNDLFKSTSKAKTNPIELVIKRDKMRHPKHISKCKNQKSRQHAQIMSSLLNHFIRYVISIFSERIQVISNKMKYSSRKPVKLSEWILPKIKIEGKSFQIQDKAFQELLKIKDDFVLNNYMVNRMDSKGEYFIRNLFEAYLNNPRQLPDYILDSYCQIKKKEIIRLGADGFFHWLRSKQEQYDITLPLREKEEKQIITFLKEESDGREFRLLPHNLIEQVLPYLAIDKDFRSSIADYISSMTDQFAEQEYKKLYL
jgi:dGTPase